jgi:hypothetical protein
MGRATCERYANAPDIIFGSEAGAPTLTLKHIVVEIVQASKSYYLRIIRARPSKELLCAFSCPLTVIAVVYMLHVCCW